MKRTEPETRASAQSTELRAEYRAQRPQIRAEYRDVTQSPESKAQSQFQITEHRA